jgi:hypothetical protein
MDTSWKEHHRHIRLERLDDSAVAEHAISLEHSIQLHNTSILSIIPRYMDRIIKEATELKPSHVNREDGFCLKKVVETSHLLPEDRRKRPSQDPHWAHRLGHTAPIRSLSQPCPGTRQP